MITTTTTCYDNNPAIIRVPLFSSNTYKLKKGNSKKDKLTSALKNTNKTKPTVDFFIILNKTMNKFKFLQDNNYIVSHTKHDVHTLNCD